MAKSRKQVAPASFYLGRAIPGRTLFSLGKVDVQSGSLQAEDLRMVWNRNSFTDPIVPSLSKVGDRKWQASPDVPVLRSLVYFWTPPADYPEAWRSKTVLIGRDPRGSYRIVGAPQSDGSLRFIIRIFGTLSIAQDAEAPVFSGLKSGSFKASLPGTSALKTTS